MSFTFRHVLASALVSGLLVSCSDSDDDGDVADDAPDLSARYQGTFLRDCFPDGPGSRNVIVSLDGFIGTQTLFDYSDADCAELAVTTVNTFAVSFPGGTQTTRLGEADFIDLEITSVTTNGVETDLSNAPLAALQSYDIALLDGINLYFGPNRSDLIENRPTELGDAVFVRQ